MLYNKDWNKDSVATVLNQCADHLEQYGWCQFELGYPQQPMCAIGVLSHHTSGEKSIPMSSYTKARNAIAAYVGVHYGAGKGGLVDWNNTPGRTKEEVIAAFRGAANSV